MSSYNYSIIGLGSNESFGKLDAETPVVALKKVTKIAAKSKFEVKKVIITENE